MVANGDCKSLDDANEIFNKVDCDGVMAARGILANPTLFSGHYATTPTECVQNWVDLAYEADTRITLQCFQHHLTFMLDKLLKSKERALFNSFSTKEQVYEFLNDKFGIAPKNIDNSNRSPIVCEYDDTKYRERVQVQTDEEEAKRYNSESSCGKFFLNHIGDNGTDDSDQNEDDDGLNCLFG